MFGIFCIESVASQPGYSAIRKGSQKDNWNNQNGRNLRERRLAYETRLENRTTTASKKGLKKRDPVIAYKTVSDESECSCLI